jgi:hypothetical protein
LKIIIIIFIIGKNYEWNYFICFFRGVSFRVRKEGILLRLI